MCYRNYKVFDELKFFRDVKNLNIFLYPADPHQRYDQITN